MNDPNDTQARKAEILRRLQAGEKASIVARDLGVSRQYVSLLLKTSQEAGTETAITRKRGRPKETPLTLEESEALRARILSSRPPEDPAPGNLWRSDEIRAWFQQTYGRRLSVHQIRRVCTESGLRLAPSVEALSFLNNLGEGNKPPPAPKDPGTEPASREKDDGDIFVRKRGRPKKSEAFETTRMTDRMMQEILKANAAAAEIMAKAREREAAKAVEARTADPAPPVRLGPKIGRNDPCPFDPKIKFKKCCGADGSVRCARQSAEPPSK